MTDSPMVCANHPNRETSLRCNRCGKPICSQCAVRTPVGYRCRECIRGQQTIFETAKSFDFPVAGVVAAFGVGLSIAVLDYLGFWGLFVSPVVGGGLAEVIRWIVRRRRSRHLPLVAAIGGVAGVVPHVLLPLVTMTQLGLGAAGFPVIGSSLFAILWPIVYGVLIIGTLYYRLRGIRV